MNVVATITALFVLLIKAILKKFGAPRKVLYFLWIIIAFRLIFPFTFESNFSLFNYVPKASDVPSTIKTFSNELENNNINENIEDTNLDLENFVIGNEKDNNYVENSPAYIENSYTKENKVNIKFTDIIMIIWILCSLAMFIYAIKSYLKLKSNLRFAIKKENYYETDMILSPCVLRNYKA